MEFVSSTNLPVASEKLLRKGKTTRFCFSSCKGVLKMTMWWLYDTAKYFHLSLACYIVLLLPVIQGFISKGDISPMSSNTGCMLLCLWKSVSKGFEDTLHTSNPTSKNPCISWVCLNFSSAASPFSECLHSFHLTWQFWASLHSLVGVVLWNIVPGMQYYFMNIHEIIISSTVLHIGHR